MIKAITKKQNILKQLDKMRNQATLTKYTKQQYLI